MGKSERKKTVAIILAAGKGSRMRRKTSKAVQNIGGLSMIGHVVAATKKAKCEEIIVVVGGNEDEVRGNLGGWGEIRFCRQKEQRGTADAVVGVIKDMGEAVVEEMNVVILNADNPLLSGISVGKIIGALGSYAVLVAGFKANNPTGYGRLILQGGELVDICEERDASGKIKEIKFCSSGLFAFAGRHIVELVKKVGNENVQKEYYIGDCVAIASKEGLNVGAIEIAEIEAMGVNTTEQLADAEAIWQRKKRKEMMAKGVVMTAPETVFFWHDTKIEADVVIEPNVVFGEKVEVKKGAKIRAFSHLEGAVVGENCVVGPYARLREGTRLEAEVKVGNFVEVKKAKVGRKSKVNHLAYVGDAVIGEEVNIGAGAITCNYDGKVKHKTKIGDKVFIGTNTAIVAPVEIGQGAMTAAGSVITEDVKENELAIGRAKQVNKKK